MALTTVGLQFEKTRADVIAALPKKKHTCVFLQFPCAFSFLFCF